jgi:serine/threonine protein kinase/Tol biopolymer transport system component
VRNLDRWRLLERIYHEAVERPVAERCAFLDSACAGDEALRQELESLLAKDGLSLLDKSALDVAARDVVSDRAPSWVGRTIRGYEILALLGAGGMGDVYRARDRSLGRDVAIKVLPDEVSRDPERLSRLEREARILAGLNHPNIATLHGLEKHGVHPFLVMELVPGQTLAERLRHGPLRVREAVDICCQIAGGLEAAHDAGIVHRDLKPANVTITPDKRVKLLDFGLAKSLDASKTGDEPTVAGSDATREGMMLGTPAYMSPEQARGQVVDRRTDIWAFGCCLYECLTGRHAFEGSTVTDILAAVLDKDPDWSALSDGLPHGVRTLLRRTLAKDFRQRLQHIGDARLELQEIGNDTNQPSAAGRRRSRAVPVLLSAAALVAIAAGVASWLGGRRPTAHTESAVARLLLKIEGETASNLRLSVNRFFAPLVLSPDGMRLVLHARGNASSQLYLRELSGFETRPIPGTETATTPFFSPDGQWIGFWRAEDRILRKVSLSGGSPIEIAPTESPLVALWTSNDEIVIEGFGQTGELWSIPASGGTPKAIDVRDRADGEYISLRAQVPGSNDLLVASNGADGTWLDVLSRETGKRRRLLRGGRSRPACYTRTGHLLYSDGNTLLAVPVNQRSELVGDPTVVLYGIDQAYLHSNVALSDNGTVIYVPVDHVREAELLWLDRDGNATPVPGGRAPFLYVSLSPDGREAAGGLVVGTKAQVWDFDLERGTKRLVSEDNSDAAIWSRDRNFITYVSGRDGNVVFRTRADGTGSAELLMRRQFVVIPEDWSPDDRALLFSEYTSRGDTDIWIYSAGKARPLIATPFNEASARFSPDGRFIAFDADDGGVSHVYVQPFPGPGPRTVISAEDSYSPEWINEGHQLFYLSGGQMKVVDVQTQPVLRISQARALNERRGLPSGIMPSPDGRRFLMLSPRAMEGPIELRIVLNWFQELERLAPHPQR